MYHIKNIKETADKLKEDIANQSIGVIHRLIEFVREYSHDTQLNRKAILLGRQFTTLSSSESSVSTDKLADELTDIIDQVLHEHRDTSANKLSLTKPVFEIEAIQSFVQNKKIALKCDSITKQFGTDFTLNPISLEIRRGDITAVVGENGNGKTTFFRIIAGELQQDKGHLSYPILDQYTDSNINWVHVKKHIAYVPQEIPRWYGNLQANLHYEAAIHGVLGDQNKNEVDFVIDRLGLREHLNKKWKNLSGGYKFRFALARALVWKPDIMILDEPLANLDVNAQLNVLNDIKSLSTSIIHPIAVFISSQHLHEVESIADNLMFLKDGMPIFNDRLKQLGVNRTENIYEVGSNLPFDDFCRLFPHSMPLSFSNNGMHYVITAGLEVTAEQILQVLINANATPDYFRNISCSSKKMFTNKAA